MLRVDTTLFGVVGRISHPPVLAFLPLSLDTDFAFPDDETFEFMMDEVAGEEGTNEGE